MTLDVTGLDVSGRCAIHGETGCFDCMVGGSNPTFTPRDHRVGNYGDQFRKPGSGNSAIDLHIREERRTATTPAPIPASSNLATDKQRTFLTQLLGERGTQMQRDAIDVETLQRWEASRLIDELMKQPRPTVTVTRARPVITSAPQAPAPSPLPQVPDGRYAIEIDGTVKFYRVNTGRDGRVWLDVQASDDLHPIHNYATKLAVFTAIAADVRGALARYGIALGVCGVCGRTLTDAESIALGIGPVCREKGGW